MTSAGIWRRLRPRLVGRGVSPGFVGFDVTGIDLARGKNGEVRIRATSRLHAKLIVIDELKRIVPNAVIEWCELGTPPSRSIPIGPDGPPPVVKAEADDAGRSLDRIGQAIAEISGGAPPAPETGPSAKEAAIAYLNAVDEFTGPFEPDDSVRRTASALREALVREGYTTRDFDNLGHMIETVFRQPAPAQVPQGEDRALGTLAIDTLLQVLASVGSPCPICNTTIPADHDFHCAAGRFFEAYNDRAAKIARGASHPTPISMMFNRT